MESENLETRRTNRTAAWASSLNSSQLHKIPEERSREQRAEIETTPDDETRKDTEPSSFPSGIFDHSYNYERGLRGPRPVQQHYMSKLVQHGWNTTNQAVSSTYYFCEDVVFGVWAWFIRLVRSLLQAISELPESPIVSILTKTIVVLVGLSTLSYLFCFVWSTRLCEPTSTSVVAQNLQKFCGSCVAQSNIHYNITGANLQDVSKISVALNSINKQIRLIESKLGDKFDSRFSSIESDLEALRFQQGTLKDRLTQVHTHNHVSSGEVPSPLIPKINFFAPNNGALVDPSRTSPTKSHTFPLLQRVFMRSLGLRKHISNPPVTALLPWHDVGDCWCSASSPYHTTDEDPSVRLAIRVREMMYPEELVIEHFPPTGSLSPDTAPKTIELWADFSHLDAQEWDRLNIRAMQANTFDPAYALIGDVEYDVNKGAGHVQSFKLNVNQYGGNMYNSQEFVLRITGNYGADYTCLYRARLHGVPVLQRKPVVGSTVYGD